MRGGPFWALEEDWGSCNPSRTKDPTASVPSTAPQPLPQLLGPPDTAPVFCHTPCQAPTTCRGAFSTRKTAHLASEAKVARNKGPLRKLWGEAPCKWSLGNSRDSRDFLIGGIKGVAFQELRVETFRSREGQPVATGSRLKKLSSWSPRNPGVGPPAWPGIGSQLSLPPVERR